MEINEYIARELGLKVSQVDAVKALLDEGGTIPFIARYRKEQTGRLDEDAIRAIQQAYAYQTNLNERKESILGLLKEKGLLTEELQKKIAAAGKLAQLEDIYRPFKEKKETKATKAIAAGLQPLADEILAQHHEVSASSSDLEGAGYILAEQFSDDSDLRQALKKEMQSHWMLTCKKKEGAADEKGIYEMYYDFSDPLNKIPGYRVLAVNRGEKEKVLTVSVKGDNDVLETIMKKRILKPGGSSHDLLTKAIHDALIRLIGPSLKREIRSELKEMAETEAIAGFGDNLEHLLMTRPLKGKSILAWDPGFANGCKLAVLDSQGNLLDTEVVFPFKGKGGEAAARKRTVQLLEQWHPDLVVIGNGTASRESERFIADILKDFPKTQFVIGSEIGASVYSASDLAKEEFPDLPVEKRSAISIGRRVQDPLSELVKIDPQALGVGQYQHDVSQKQLREMLDFVTDKAVNRVGVNVNTASVSLLKHIAGLTRPQIARLIARRQKSPFANRQELASILPEKAYEQSIGFLRVNDGTNPLDATGIHPESYGLAQRLLTEYGLKAEEMRTDHFVKTLKRINPSSEAKKLGTDVYTMAQILKELIHPGLDPRDAMDAPILKKDVLEITDLKPGMELEGTVRNVTSFGAFVDIGLHEDGLVHISRMADHFVKDPREIVHTGQIVKVFVVDTDVRRNRIGLSMVASKR